SRPHPSPSPDRVRARPILPQGSAATFRGRRKMQKEQQARDFRNSADDDNRREVTERIPNPTQAPVENPGNLFRRCSALLARPRVRLRRLRSVVSPGLEEAEFTDVQGHAAGRLPQLFGQLSTASLARAAETPHSKVRRESAAGCSRGESY